VALTDWTLGSTEGNVNMKRMEGCKELLDGSKGKSMAVQPTNKMPNYTVIRTIHKNLLDSFQDILIFSVQADVGEQ